MKPTLIDIRDFVDGLDTNVLDRRKGLVSSIGNVHDKEIVAIIASWLYNGYACEWETIEKVVGDMMPSPIGYVMKGDDGLDKDNGSFCGMMTNKNYANLIRCMKDCHVNFGGVRESYMMYMGNKRNKCKHSHDALALMLSGCTGFPTMASKSTFFRYNYLLYLIHTLHLWDGCIDYTKSLLPCNDVVMKKAYVYGITPTLLRSDKHGTIQLTNLAKTMFGLEDFYVLWEFLNFAKDNNDDV